MCGSMQYVSRVVLDKNITLDLKMTFTLILLYWYELSCTRVNECTYIYKIIDNSAQWSTIVHDCALVCTFFNTFNIDFAASNILFRLASSDRRYHRYHWTELFHFQNYTLEGEFLFLSAGVLVSQFCFRVFDFIHVTLRFHSYDHSLCLTQYRGACSYILKGCMQLYIG